MVSTSSSRISSGSTLMAEKAACGWKVLATLEQKGEDDHQSHTILSRGVKVSCTGEVSKNRFGVCRTAGLSQFVSQARAQTRPPARTVAEDATAKPYPWPSLDVITVLINQGPSSFGTRSANPGTRCRC